MQLKTYQTESLDTLSNFLRECKLYGIETAYKTYAVENENNQYSGDAYTPITNHYDCPSVCIRIPTGGGKTILASRSIKIASDFVEKEYPVVLWLVPSDTIRTQTVDALKNHDHPYRKEIDQSFGGTTNVRVVDLEDFKNILPNDISDSVCIVVGTVQALRISNTNLRKVYAHNEYLEPHFAGVPSSTPHLEKDNKGNIKFSFVNLMALHRPVMILDEGHRFKSQLSEELLDRLHPSLVIEFTATPKGKKNVLVSVSASVLRDENMIKMPVRLTQHSSWELAVNGAIKERNVLHKICEDEGEQIRPIVLFQAENRDKEVNVSVLKNHLIENENIDPEKIAVATGEQRELDGIDVMAQDCKIEYIITVQALKEGWDCPYAYVFCSVANIKSATDIEQLLGRVLRMPFAKRRNAFELNSSYAHLPDTTGFASTANALVDKLIDMGFDESEAEEALQQSTLLPDRAEEIQAMFLNRTVDVKSEFSFDTIDISSEKIKIIVEPSGEKKVKILSALTEDEKKLLSVNLVGNTQAKQDFKRTIRTVSKLFQRKECPANNGKKFDNIGMLCLDYGEGFITVTPETFLEALEWNPLNYDHLVKFSFDEKANTFVLDLGLDEKIAIQSTQQFEIPLDEITTKGEEMFLINWLEKQLRTYARNMLGQSMIIEYSRRNIKNLVDNGTPLNKLIRFRHQFFEALKRNLTATQECSTKDAMQQFLFAPDAKVTVENIFELKPYTYNPSQQYHGRTFTKHFYGAVANMNGEELEVADTLDHLTEVEYWVRNLERGDAFKLPLAMSNFYPDFVAKLRDGRVLVVEHKGEHLIDGQDSQEKLTIGNFWAEKTGNIFIMTTKNKISEKICAQIQNVIESRNSR